MDRCSVCNQPISGVSQNRTICKQCRKKIAKKEYYAKTHGTATERRQEKQTLHEYILKLRSQGYTLKQIAEKTGLHKSSISYYLSGKRTVGIAAVHKWRASTSD